jgi:PhnB protein
MSKRRQFVRPKGVERQKPVNHNESETIMTTTATNHPGRVEPYLFFDGRCDEAIQFYKKALGAEVQMLMRFKECPDPKAVPPGQGEKVMHASLRIGETSMMASDGQCKGVGKFEGFALSIGASTEAEADRWFAALAEGGQVRMPLAKTFFSPKFGMVADRFGVTWMVLVSHQ